MKATVRVLSLKQSPKIGIKLDGDKYIRLSFRNGGRDNFHATLIESYKKKAWDQKVVQKKEPTQPAKSEFSTLHAGVGRKPPSCSISLNTNNMK